MKVQLVKHPETGQLITVNPNKPEYGTIRVDSTQVQFTGGFANKVKRTAFVNGEIETLEAIVSSAQGGWLPGKIQVLESFEPFYAGQTGKVNPETGEELKSGGKTIYRQSIYTQNVNASDVLIQHDAVNIAVETPAEAIAGNN